MFGVGELFLGKETFDRNAAYSRKEPKVTDAAEWTSVCFCNKADIDI